MQRTAQKRSLLNKLREMTDVGGIATEKYFNPEFKQVMDQLREIDDGIRAIASGEQVGAASAPSDAISLKDILKSAKSNLNRREYMKAVADLGRFHKKVFDMVHLLSLFRSNIDKIHEKFLFQDLDDDSKKYLQSFKGRWPEKSAGLKPYFIKEANILDFFTNIATERGRALASWEKRYPKRVDKLKKDSASILSLSERMLGIILTSLKDLAKARATRNADNYIAISDKISNAFKNYDGGDKGFKVFYQENVREFLEKQEFFTPTKVDVTNKPQDLGKKDIGVQPINSPIDPDDLTKTQIMPAKPQMSNAPGVPIFAPINPTSIPQMPKIPSMPPGRKIDPNSVTQTGPIALPVLSPDPNDSFDDTKTTQMAAKVAPAHRKFMESLQSMGEESPSLLASHISRYAKSIWSKDPETAIKLFKIVKNIKG